ncbi:MAG: FAD-dependent oxidoreductase, partial [Gammaproteobacteria bacterium]|nr:FAD-dependent oxidoreductase [Gammaproteobacteria bacterium]NIU41037.1 FAD-dependent oxidoreductase [Gammaproteobacteria bacterium]
PGSEHVLPAEVVIFSLGQTPGLDWVGDESGVEMTGRRTVAVDARSYATARPGVFAAGDSVTGTAFVIDAVAAGRHCAEAMHRYLRGHALEKELAAAQPVAAPTRQEVDARILRGEIAFAPRVPMPTSPMRQRRASFAEVEIGYSAEQARAEAARCLQCGVCSECLSCVYACGMGAIDLDMQEQTRRLEVGALVLAPGFQVYQAELSQEYGFGRFDNVVTSLQYERLLSPSGPTAGHVKRPSDGATPKKIAFLQCVGSRDPSHDYCSTVCCMYAAKQAVMTLEHEPDTQLHVFMMDMRSFSKNFEAYYQRAREM